MTDERIKKSTVPGFALPNPPAVQVTPMDLEDEVTEATPPSVVEIDAANVEPRPFERAPQPAPAAPSAQAESARRRGQPAVDIDLVYERRSAPLPDSPWVFLEIWTQNTIYALDSRMICIDVIDQLSKRSLGEHALRGARLVGGQTRDGATLELSHPFPRPGSEAVFEQLQGRHVRFSQTSSVTRVVMRLRVLTVAQEQLLPTWEEVTGSRKLPTT